MHEITFTLVTGNGINKGQNGNSQISRSRRMLTEENR
jgi:hypothetical protein